MQSLEHEKRLLEERCKQNSNEYYDEEKLKSMKEDLLEYDEKVRSLTSQESDYFKQIKQLKEELDAQRRQGAGTK